MVEWRYIFKYSSPQQKIRVGSFTPGEDLPVPIKYEAEWVQDPVSRLWRR
jgi:hypothetical protein